jgi:hypothetical protein
VRCGARCAYLVGLCFVLSSLSGCTPIYFGDTKIWPPPPNVSGRWTGKIQFPGGPSGPFGTSPHSIDLKEMVLIEVSDGGVTGSVTMSDLRTDEFGGPYAGYQTVPVIGKVVGGSVYLSFPGAHSGDIRASGDANSSSMELSIAWPACCPPQDLEGQLLISRVSEPD